MALETPDGRWRVEVVQRGAQVKYRVLHDGEEQIGWGSIAAIEHLLAKRGVSMADLSEVSSETSVTDNDGHSLNLS